MSEKTEVLSCNVKGIALYPKKEDGVKSYAIQLDLETIKALNSEVSKKFGAMGLSYGSNKDTGDLYLNVKSQYDIPVYDKEGNVIETPVYHGAEVIVSVSIKPYTYKGKSGLTTYLKCMIVINNGEETGTSFKSIMGNVL